MIKIIYVDGKDHKPNPIVQIGLFMDGDGIPLAFSINRGNMNEQLTLKPLEKKILSDFELSKFVVCTDAGLSSEANRKFNDKDGRDFITTQPIKKLKAHLRIMKSEFEARPVYLSKDERIEAHFITCFIALVVYRLLEKRLNEEFTCSEIIKELREMNFKEIKGEGYEPIYTGTDFTDAIREAFGFRTDYQIVTTSMMKKLRIFCNITKACESFHTNDLQAFCII